MKNSLVTSGAAISLCLIALSGCASNETTADLMRDSASSGQDRVDMKNQIAKDWERGKKLIVTGKNRVENGEEQVESAEDKLENGYDKIEQGEREIAEGQKLVRESERKFRNNYPEVDLNQQN